MKPIQQLLSSRWMKLLAVLLVTAWCSSVNAAYWDHDRSQTHTQGRDLDGDGIPNVVDPDVDNDGIPNMLDRNVNGGIAKTGPFAGQYIGDHADNDNPSEEDIDDDGLSDDSLAEKDIDGDAKLDNDATENDIDGDGRRNDDPAEMDIDGDGVSNDDATESDDDGDDIDDFDDDDDNNDGIKDIDDDNHHAEVEEDEVQANLNPQPAAPAESSAKVTLQHFGTGAIKFVVDAKDLAAGDYELLVGGLVKGTVVVVEDSGHTRGILVFKTAASGGTLLLDFTVAGQSIALRQSGTDYFSGTAPLLPAATGGDDSITLFRGPGATNEGQAEVSIHFEASGPTSLEIDMGNVPAGDYSVVIGDAARGMLHVVISSGELHFGVGASGATLPLDFPCAGQSIAIMQGSTSFFFGQLPSAP